MKAHGNGTPETCASNLMRIVRGEVPYDRVRGWDGELEHSPNISAEAVTDAEWVLETYEPRVNVAHAEAIIEAATTGDFSILLNIERKEDDE